MTIAKHVLSAFTGLQFLMGGGMKLTGAMVEQFAAWGLPGAFSYVTGVVEIVGALLVFFPRTRMYGGALLAAWMVGAIGTHVVNGEVAASIPAVIAGGLAAAVAWLHRPAPAAALASA